MANPYLTDELAEATKSHKLAMAEMERAAQTQGDKGVRAVQIWGGDILPLLSPEEALEAGGVVQANAKAMWVRAKAHEARSLDATAAAMGVTRKALLDELAAIDPTSFA